MLGIDRNLDLNSAELTADPYAYFKMLRTADPVHWHPRHRAWIVTRYEDVVALFRDQRLSANRLSLYRDRRLSERERSDFGRTFEILESWMNFQDEPNHRRLRGIVRKAFSPPMVNSLRPRIEETVARSVSSMHQFVNSGDTFDLLADVAYAIPAAVIADMLGVPGTDLHRFIGWSEDLVDLISGNVLEPNRNEKAHRATIELELYLTNLLDRYASRPTDNLLSALIEAEEDGERLTRVEVIATAILLLFGGHRTTACLICNGSLALMRNTDQLERLRADPELVSNAVEEFLRYEGHTKLTVRVVKEPFDYKGRALLANDRVFLVQLSANRDERKFEEPDRFDIGRSNAIQHVGFGNGPHHCLGAPLARLETQIAIRAFVEHLPQMEHATTDALWEPTLISRSQKSLAVRFRR